MAPVVLFITFALFTIGLAVNSNLIVSDAARVGARRAAVVAGEDQEVQEARAAVCNYMAKNQLKVNISNGPCGKATDAFDPSEDLSIQRLPSDPDYIEVTVNYCQPSIIRGLPKLVGGSPWPDCFPLESKAVYLNER